MAQLDRVAHALAAQVEVAVAQTQRLVDRLVRVDLERRRLGVGEQLDLLHGQLDLAGGELRVDRALLAPHHAAAGGQHVLGAQGVSGGVRLGRLLRAEDELQQPGAVAQVDEDQAAVIAPAVHPAGNTRLAVHVVRAQVARPGRAVAVLAGRLHEPFTARTASSTLPISRCSPVRMSRS